MKFSWNNMKIKSKILLPMLILGLIPLFVVGGYAILSNNSTTSTSEDALQQEIGSRFSAMMAEKTAEINGFFEDRHADLELTIDSFIIQEHVAVLVGYDAGNITNSAELLNDYLKNTLDNFGYSRIVVLDDTGTVLLYQVSDEEKAKAMERGESLNDLGEDYSAKRLFTEVWASTSEEGVVFTDAIAVVGSVTTDSEDVTLSHLIIDPHDYAKIGSVHFTLDLDVVFNMVTYRDAEGNFDQEEYDERGLGESGDQYLVQTSSKTLYSLSRFQTHEREGVLSLKIETDGVLNAISNGLYYGVYDDYRGVPVVGYTWNFAAEVSGTDDRVAEDVARRSSFNLPWIYVLEIDEAEAFASISVIEDSNQSVILAIVIALVAATIIIFGAGTFISNNLSKSIVFLANSMKRGASGDLTKDNDEDLMTDKLKLNGDEIGDVSNAYAELLTSIRNIVSGTQESVGILSTASEDLFSGAEEINASSEEVASTSQAMSNGATSQTEMIAEVNEDIQKTQKMVEEIIKKIQDNTQDVSQIALQTNILALNAGIEASRAGDYGRGFMVVAENVRKLSDQSKVASEQIAMVADEIEQNLQASFSAITNSMGNIVSVSEETAASAEEVAAAAEEMTATVEELSSSASQLTTTAEESSAMIGQFTIETNGKEVHK